MAHRSERDRMLAGALYSASDPDLLEARRRAKRLCRAFNSSSESDPEFRREVLAKLLGRIGRRIEVEPPFFCDYGANIRVGDNLYINTGCVVLDGARVIIGRNVLLGPGVHLYTATHPINTATRRSGRELAEPITIGNDVWIGGGAIVCPGVTIGSGCIIGAGSVVTRGIPAGAVAAGNPCRVLRPARARPRRPA